MLSIFDYFYYIYKTLLRVIKLFRKHNSAVTKCLTKSTLGAKGSFWFMMEEGTGKVA